MDKYDTKFKVLADYHLNLKLWIKGASCKCYKTTIAEVNAGGVSRVFNRSLYLEERLLKKDALGGVMNSLIQKVWTSMKYLNKQYVRYRSKS